MGIHDKPELAYKGAIHRVIPNTKDAEISVAASSGTTAGALTAFKGRWIWLAAEGGDVTVLRGANTVVFKRGLNIKDGEFQDFFVPYDAASYDLSHIGSAACRLCILSDSETA